MFMLVTVLLNVCVVVCVAFGSVKYLLVTVAPLIVVVECIVESILCSSGCCGVID